MDNTEPQYLIIPAAGLGTRMQVVNPDLPKELLPVGHKPAIQYTVEEGISAGIRNVVVIISKQKEIIRRYFEDKNVGRKLYPLADEELARIDNKCSLTFLYQKESLGESDAISYAKDIVGNHSIAVMYPDNLYVPSPGALKILKPVFNKYRIDVIALNKVSEDISQTISNAGRVDIQYLENSMYCIQKFHPKTRDPFITRFKGELRSCGISISGPHFFDYVERLRTMLKEGELTDTPVRSLVLKEKGLLGCRLPGTVFDLGNPEGYELCLSYMKKT